MTLALLCPGQGAQHAGMFALTGQHPAAQAIFEHAQLLLGHDPRTWVQTASKDSLHANRIAQILCTLQPLAAAAALSDAIPERYCAAGYSVGEVGAWHLAGMIDADKTLDLVASRAEGMDAAQRANPGLQGLLFVRGLNRRQVDEICASQQVSIAIINPGDAWILGGMTEALQRVSRLAVASGATRVVPVDVRVASHTRLMEEGAATFERQLEASAIIESPRPGVRLFSGVDGEVVLNARDGKKKLSQQISHTVQWSACLDACIEAGATAFLELGPGRALTAMVSAAYPGASARSLEDFHTLQGAREWIHRATARN
ncbi:malonate decarboxylase subunit epsilon [Stenotrophomonas indicatrix]|uniref:ACP S-malonyltransferase n=1 Tax=Stenotrophomonas indicatrix TaxID=2045451 RepID=UPI000C190A5A|nr:acyltransferase domain-containing protein [Stenotrophomonas indicatrix]PII15845.1 malonate decarboxylase subunit epsilon [Stenotrophomonas indicatrix]